MMNDLPLTRVRPSASPAEQHEQLRIVSLALWRVVKSRLDLQDDELRFAMRRVADELQRAPRTPAIVDCAVCRRPMQRSAATCLYCGTRAADDAVVRSREYP